LPSQDFSSFRWEETGKKEKRKGSFLAHFGRRDSRIPDCRLRIDLLTLVPNQLLAGWKARPTLSLFAVPLNGGTGKIDKDAFFGHI